ncbi:hypothetical protein Hanom_Chr04g00378981 [Helianthus anomalus]
MWWWRLWRRLWKMIKALCSFILWSCSCVLGPNSKFNNILSPAQLVPCGWACVFLWEVTGSKPGYGISGGGSPNDGSFLLRHDAVLRATRFYPAVTPASLSCGGNMVSGRRSACATAGARSNIASGIAGLTGECHRHEPGDQ